MNPFSILMFIFSGALLIYAGLLALTRNYNMIPRGYAANPADKRTYARAFAKTMAVVALAPLNGGYFALFSPMLGAVMLALSFIACIKIGADVFRKSIYGQKSDEKE